MSSFLAAPSAVATSYISLPIIPAATTPDAPVIAFPAKPADGRAFNVLPNAPPYDFAVANNPAPPAAVAAVPLAAVAAVPPAAAAVVPAILLVNQDLAAVLANERVARPKNPATSPAITSGLVNNPIIAALSTVTRAGTT